MYSPFFFNKLQITWFTYEKSKFSSKSLFFVLHIFFFFSRRKIFLMFSQRNLKVYPNIKTNITMTEWSRSEAVIHIFLMKINPTWIEHWQFKQFMVFYLLQNIVINTFQPLLCSSCVLQHHQHHCKQQLCTVELIQDTADELLSTKIWPTFVTS